MESIVQNRFQCRRIFVQSHVFEGTAISESIRSYKAFSGAFAEIGEGKKIRTAVESIISYRDTGFGQTDRFQALTILEGIVSDFCKVRGRTERHRRKTGAILEHIIADVRCGIICHLSQRSTV